MDWIAKSQPHRTRYWPEVEAFFGNLPPDLYRQGVLLRHDLATAYSANGQFAGILSRDSDYPLLDLHVWLLEDWGFPNNDLRPQLEQHLLIAMVLFFGAAYIRESILDEDTNFDARYQALEAALTRGRIEHLARLFPPDSAFWNYYAVFAEESTHPLSTVDFELSSDHVLRQLGAQLAFAKVPAAAIALQLGQPYMAQLPKLFHSLEIVSGVIRLRRDIITLRRDLWRGRRTYPIARTLRIARSATTPEQILGAMVLTGTLREVISESIEQLEAARAQADDINLPTLSAYIEALKDELWELSQLFSLNGPAATQPAPKAIFAPTTDSLSLALEMAERYLLSDPTWRESWEVQRRGMFGEPELIGRAFAPGLVVEALCQHRADLTEHVDGVLKNLSDNGFRYYPHPGVPPDADDLGLALRLFPYSSQTDIQRQRLQQPLRWMAANLTENGRIACWFTQGVEEFSNEQTLLWGNTCATVEASLLLGLMADDYGVDHAVIQRSAAQWVDRWVASGLGGNTLYVSEYALWVAVELIARLSAYATPARIFEAGERCHPHWQTQVEHLTTPQAAAFLTLASVRLARLPGSRYEFDPAWIRLMLKNQRYDGSWAGEPLFVTPTRGDVAAWYSSNTVTTAYIWHALKTYARWRER